MKSVSFLKFIVILEGKKKEEKSKNLCKFKKKKKKKGMATSLIPH